MKTWISTILTRYSMQPPAIIFEFSTPYSANTGVLRALALPALASAVIAFLIASSRCTAALLVAGCAALARVGRAGAADLAAARHAPTAVVAASLLGGRRCHVRPRCRRVSWVIAGCRWGDFSVWRFSNPRMGRMSRSRGAPKNRSLRPYALLGRFVVARFLLRHHDGHWRATHCTR